MVSRGDRGRRLFAVLMASALVVVPSSACDGTGEGQRKQSITVFAAASLTAAFNEIAQQYQREPGAMTVKFNYAGSSTLATQLHNGAAADVFASADEANMKKVADEGLLLGPSRDFAHNRLAIIVAAGNPKKIDSLRDLTRPGLTVVACAPEVPAGRYAREAFAKAGLTMPAGSQELDVKQVVNRVRLGEADAGIAYVTDAVAEGATGSEAAGGGAGTAAKVSTVAIPDQHNVVARYYVADLTKEGDAFVRFLLGDAARQTLRKHGFTAP